MADISSISAFYLNPSLENAVDFVKHERRFNAIVVYWVDVERLKTMEYRGLVPDEQLWREVVVASRCQKLSVVQGDDFVYGYQLKNPRKILAEWQRRMLRIHGKKSFPKAKWSEPIRDLQLAIRTIQAATYIDSCHVGTIYFHTK